MKVVTKLGEIAREVGRKPGLNHLSLNEGGHISGDDEVLNHRLSLNHLSLNEGGHLVLKCLRQVALASQSPFTE